MFHCEQCTYNTKIKCNFIRHTKTCKKRSENNTMDGANVNVDGANVNVDGANVNVCCYKCNKVFVRAIDCRKHEEKCDGSHALQCKFCLKMFTTRQGKNQHTKYVKCNPQSQAISSTIINNIHNDNSTTNNTSIINNNITIQLNVHGKENYDALLDTIRSKYPQAFVTMVEEGDTASLLKLVHFNKDFPENQTIRKPIKKDVSAEVHVGEGRWEKRPSQEVSDTFTGHTSKRLCHSMYTTVPTNVKQHVKFLHEVLYEQSRAKSGNTASLLKPFVLSKEEFAKKELSQKINEVERKLLGEYPSLVGTKMFENELKRMTLPYIQEFENGLLF